MDIKPVCPTLDLVIDLLPKVLTPCSHVLGEISATFVERKKEEKH